MSIKKEFEVLQWLKKYRDAVIEGDDSVTDDAGDNFNDLIELVVDLDRADELQAMFDAITDADADVAFEAYARVAKSFGELKDGFEIGTAMAAGAEKKLFFPSVAAELSTIDGSLKALKSAAESLIEDLGDVQEDFNAGDVASLIKDASSSKDKLNELLTALDDLKLAISGDD
ncbi:MAG: hypothetical protein COB83_04130 [Gammaproteobacteria bacterium]|nr:MAG: hypothetical protein COB83_04130 [Gammaproteobacteria bacterium]